MVNRVVLFSALLVAVLTGCKTDVRIPDVVREPSVVGEISEILPGGTESPGDRLALYRLDTSDTLTVDLNSATSLLQNREPGEGDLLLYGEEPDGPWFWSGPLLHDPRTGGQCAEIMAPALDEGDTIVFELGLRLPKADGFDPFDVTDGEFSDPTKGFCLNERGEVTRYRP